MLRVESCKADDDLTIASCKVDDVLSLHRVNDKNKYKNIIKKETRGSLFYSHASETVTCVEESQEVSGRETFC